MAYQHSMVISLQVFSFCFNRVTDHESSLCVVRSGFTKKINRSKLHGIVYFVVFIFVCPAHVQNIQKLAPYKNFLLFGCICLGQKTALRWQHGLSLIFSQMFIPKPVFCTTIFVDSSMRYKFEINTSRPQPVSSSMVHKTLLT